MSKHKKTKSGGPSSNGTLTKDVAEADSTKPKTSVAAVVSAPAANWAAKALKTATDPPKAPSGTAKIQVTPEGIKRVEPQKAEPEEPEKEADEAMKSKQKQNPKVPAADAFAITLSDIAEKRGDSQKPPEFMVNENWRPKRTNSNPPPPKNSFSIISSVGSKAVTSSKSAKEGSSSSNANSNRTVTIDGDPEYNPHLVIDVETANHRPLFAPVPSTLPNNGGNFLDALKSAKKANETPKPDERGVKDNNSNNSNSSHAIENGEATGLNASSKGAFPQSGEFPTLISETEVAVPAITSSWGAPKKDKSVLKEHGAHEEDTSSLNSTVTSDKVRNKPLTPPSAQIRWGMELGAKKTSDTPCAADDDQHQVDANCVPSEVSRSLTPQPCVESVIDFPVLDLGSSSAMSAGNIAKWGVKHDDDGTGTVHMRCSP